MSNIIFDWHSESPSIIELEAGLKSACASKSSALLILACQDNSFTAQKIDSLLIDCSLPVFGGIYPNLMYKNQLMQQGCIVIGFEHEVEISTLHQVSRLLSEEQLIDSIESMSTANANALDNDSCLMFYDALIDNTEDFLDCLFESLDHRINVMGGGAGSLAFEQAPCIFTNQGLIQDAIQIVSLKSKMATAATHGWQVLKGPFLVSETDKNNLMSLNYQPAFDVYKHQIEEVSQFRFDDNNFFDIAKNYPLGVQGINGELIVRDPIATQNGELQCVGNIPLNSMVHLLEGNTESLIHAAEEAAITVKNKMENKGSSAVIVFDCISRVLYLGDNFSLELDSISKQLGSKILFGVACIGEITNSESGAIKLLNKSTVIGSW